jgi:hypothetical protein
MSRRTALLAAAGLAGLALVGCTPEEPRRGEDAPRPAEPEVDPDVAVAAEALANQEQILALLAATRTRHPRLDDLLAPAVAAHESHAALLGEAVPGGVSATPSASASPSTAASPSQTSPDARRTSVPGDRARALRQVVNAERDLALATKRHAFRAQSGAFARLLGSMAAAAAQQETVLATAPVPGGGGS